MKTTLKTHRCNFKTARTYCGIDVRRIISIPVKRVALALPGEEPTCTRCKRSR